LRPDRRHVGSIDNPHNPHNPQSDIRYPPSDGECGGCGGCFGRLATAAGSAMGAVASLVTSNLEQTNAQIAGIEKRLADRDSYGQPAVSGPAAAAIRQRIAELRSQAMIQSGAGNSGGLLMRQSGARACDLQVAGGRATDWLERGASTCSIPHAFLLSQPLLCR
jgi:hypothetical protein